VRLRTALALSLVCASAAAKPKDRSKDAQALKMLERANKASTSGDVPGAVRTLDEAVRLCKPEDACTSKTQARLHMSLGTIHGVGEGDYEAAKREFILAIALDPDSRLRALATPELTKAFDDARAAVSGAPPTPPTKPEPPPPSVHDLFHPEENPPPPKPEPPKPEPPKPEPPKPAPPPEKGRMNWFSLRAIFDFAYLSDANICSPGAPSNYYCTDETGAHYTGTPQPFNDVSKGFAYSTTRLVLGYERVLAGGFSAGGFVGYAFRFAPTPEGRKAFFPIHLELRGTYTFGRDPFEDDGDRIAPFVFLALGAQQVDTHVSVRVNEIPCASKVEPACHRDLDAYRILGNGFAAIGGGVRYRIEGPHAIRAGARATLLFGDSGLVLSPEIAYELGY
jgi:hypothetical protein